MTYYANIISNKVIIKKGVPIVKKIFILVCILACIQVSAKAEEQTNQTVTNTNSYLGLNMEKKPIQETGKQAIKNEKSFLFINIIINGKTPYDKTDNQGQKN